MHAAFWRDKRVLVTGHTGFKGGWLSLWLASLGARVTGFALPAPSEPSLCRLTDLEAIVDSRLGDINDLEALARVVSALRPEVVFHLAAQPLVGRSYLEPALTYRTNVIGTLNLLEAVRHVPAPVATVIVTSDKCYRTRDTPAAYREEDPLGGGDPYSSSKAGAELVAAAYRSSFFVEVDGTRKAAVATVRAGNAVGGGDWAIDRLVPDCLRAFSARRAVSIRNPEAVRPWQHVLEPLSGYLLLAQRLFEDGAAFAEAWNFGPRDSDCRPVAAVVETLARLCGMDDAIVVDSAAHPPESNYLKLDSSKACRRLDWSARWDLDTALKATVDWHEAHRSGSNMRETTLRQIDRYASSALR